MPKAKINALGSVLDLLHELGYEPDGATEYQTFRVITQASYPLAGAEIHLGGRLRFHKPDTDRYATVGKRLVCVYQKSDKTESHKIGGQIYSRQVHVVANSKVFKTKEIEAIRNALAS